MLSDYFLSKDTTFFFNLSSIQTKDLKPGFLNHLAFLWWGTWRRNLWGRRMGRELLSGADVCAALRIFDLHSPVRAASLLIEGVIYEPNSFTLYCGSNPPERLKSISKIYLTTQEKKKHTKNLLERRSASVRHLLGKGSQELQKETVRGSGSRRRTEDVGRGSQHTTGNSDLRRDQRPLIYPP